MGQTRLKSSFIYLANAVNDLRANWAALAIVLAPLVLMGAICALPDALNLQHLVAESFAPGLHNVSWIPVQKPYPAAAVKPLFPHWALLLFHILLAALTVIVQLFVMCTIRRVQAGVQRPQIFTEALEIYREALRQIMAFLWIQLLVFLWVQILLYLAFAIGLGILIVPGLLPFVWLFLAGFTLVFDDHQGFAVPLPNGGPPWKQLFHAVWRIADVHRSFTALVRSRELLRKRFFRAACRIVVFLAVWSGYNTWVAGAFLLLTIFIGPVRIYSGAFLAIFFLIELLSAAAGFATTAFFVAAGSRLYRDLAVTLKEDDQTTASLSATAG